MNANLVMTYGSFFAQRVVFSYKRVILNDTTNELFKWNWLISQEC